MVRSFLPVWEGVSRHKILIYALKKFPPCMGGCIGHLTNTKCAFLVSSLYGRVYRCGQRSVLYVVFPIGMFPPCMGGCIIHRNFVSRHFIVSSLYGRVYRRPAHTPRLRHCFLPVWEGVSLKEIMQTGKSEFPPCLGGCIA